MTCFWLISLLCCCSKVFEKLIFDKIYYFFDKVAPMSVQSVRSAALQLIIFLDQTFEYNDLQATRELSVLYLDFA